MFKKPAPSPDAPAAAVPPWRVLVVDDAAEVHSITRLTLSDFEYLGRPLAFLGATSAAEARELLAATTDIALAFIDVVMETDHAGLDLVTHIRNVLGDRNMRIILRTGQPGMAPERQVIRDFEINDYMNKTQASADKLYTSTLAALRAYDGLVTLERSRRQLECYRDGLETVIEATSNLFEQRSLRLFASGLLRQLSAMLAGAHQSMIVRAHGVSVMQTGSGFEVLAKAGRFDDPQADPLSPQVAQRLQACMARQRSAFDGDTFVGYFPTRSGVTNLIYLDGVQGAGAVDMRLLDIFSKNISIAFENLYLDREVRETQAEIIATLGDVVETRSKETANHVRRVAHLSALLGAAAGLDEEHCSLLLAASPMHDVGKVAIPDSILLKPGPLTDDEWVCMKEHARIGEEVFGRSTRPMLRAAAIIAGQHHEKYDGTGYPRGLRGEEIHIFARIVALVDVFDALAHARCYKPAWPMDRVLQLLRDERGRHFDPQLVDCLLAEMDAVLDVLARYPDGTQAAAAAAVAPAGLH
ncbi:DUF3369 domain-containing protein [Aquincola sp. MAHUQ-54]|uniref:DUF3369 domain-containing protein n=1 Tax=Aquincola agrisoli TaxID=3119538 RepID=A0AAW9Q4X8_9BURK